MGMLIGIGIGVPFGGGAHPVTGPGGLPYVYVDSDVTVDRIAGTATFTVKLASASALTVTTVYGTLDGTATAPDDYTATTGTLTFNPGDLTKTVSVPISDLFYPTPQTYFLFGLIVATNADVRPDSLIADGFAPTTPGTPTATLVGTNELDWTWTAATDNVAVDHYLIEHHKTGDGYTTAGTSATNSFNDTGLSTNTIYTARITAYDAAGNHSVASGEGTHATADTQAPSVPSGMTATAGDSKVTLAWSASTDNVAVDHYEYQQCTGAACTPSGAWTSMGNVLTFDVTSLANTTVYGFSVRAVDTSSNASAGCSTQYATPVSASFLTANFNALTAATTLHTADANWNVTTDNVGLSQTTASSPNPGRVRNAATTGLSAYYNSAVTPANADYEVSADFIMLVIGNSVVPGIRARQASGTIDFYEFKYQHALTQLALVKRVAGGSTTQMGSAYSITFVINHTYNLKIRAKGTTITAYLSDNGVPVNSGNAIITATDSGVSAAGFPAFHIESGVVGESTGVHVDNVVATYV